MAFRNNKEVARAFLLTSRYRICYIDFHYSKGFYEELWKWNGLILGAN